MTLTIARGLKILTVILASIILTACDDPFDCIIDDRPVLNTENFRQPVLNQVYDSTITVSIKNNTDDNEFGYTWRLTGDLPPGISYYTDNRELIFSGSATALGEYPFTVRVSVSSDNSWQDSDAANASDLCRESVTRNYVLTVAPQ